MKRFLLLCILVNPLVASAQVYPFTSSAPRLMKPDINKVTGDTIWKTSASCIADQGSSRKPDTLECVVMKKKRNVALFIYLTKGNDKADLFSINKGSRLTIKFTDSTSLTLQSANAVSAVLDATQKNTVLCWGLYNLQPDEVPILKNNELSSIQIETSVGSFNYPVKEKNSDLIARQLGLVAGK